MEKLKAWITDNNLTQREFAAMVGLSPTAVHQLLRGRNAPSVVAAIKIDDATGGAVPVRSWVE
jgi:transcriptional regulator with XRE-family HTH domain